MKSLTQSDCKGAALVEYGILVGLIAVGAIASVVTLGNQVDKVFSFTGTTIAENLAASATPSEGAPAFTFTDGNLDGFTMSSIYSSVDTTTGYSGVGTPRGSKADNAPSAMEVRALFNYNASDPTKAYSDIWFDGNTMSTSGLTLRCNHGTWNIPSPLAYNTGADATVYRWANDIPRPIFEDATDYQCEVL